MRRKLFIGLELPEDIRKRLNQKVSKWQNLPVMWAKEDRLHLTLAFLGLVDDAYIPEMCKRLSAAAESTQAFEVTFSHIGLGPTHSQTKPKMVWLIGEGSEAMKEFHSRIELTLGLSRKDSKAFRPHVTLGRIKQKRWAELIPSPQINEPFHFSMPVDRIHVFETYEEGGKHHSISIENCELSYE